VNMSRFMVSGDRRAGVGHTVYRGLALAIITQTTTTGNTPRDIEHIFSFQYTFSTPLVCR
ncbi:hypothetical protein, partial [Corynebacterium ulcerans]|uniref:hypothetical protein n=1 Tax=Corynebacterium ulcerans TaxID=65058 RepID=UPI001A7E1896